MSSRRHYAQHSDYTPAFDFDLADLVHQFLPLVTLIIVPTLVVLLVQRLNYSAIFYRIAMGLESLWNWNWSSSSHALAVEKTGRRKGEKKKIRTRAQQLQLQKLAHSDTKLEERQEEEEEEDRGYYPGLVNISGTYCFMNSTLQGMASLAYLQPHIDSIHIKAEDLDVPTPVIDSLRRLFDILNTPKPRYHSLRPLDIIETLSTQEDGRNNALLCSREHQDAQELFQLLSECVKNETGAVDKEGYRDRGLGGLQFLESGKLNLSSTAKERKSVFDGLTANRRSCVQCGYTEAVMHFGFDNWQLAVPRKSTCYLEECLADYTRLELLTDCICRRCSILATHARLLAEREQLSSVSDPSTSKKKRLREVRKMEARVKAAIDQGRIEEEMKDVRMEKVVSKVSTKQAMVARPPPILVLHINRSVSFGAHASKNTVRLIFPEVLDLSPYTTSGSLSTVPSFPISSPPAPASPAPYAPRSTTPTTTTPSGERTLYRLSSVVCHFGAHSYGHYIAYRRKPRRGGRCAIPQLLSSSYPPPTAIDDDDAEEEWVWADDPPRAGTGKGWLRISDDDVTEVGVESVLAEGSGAFMLYYERVVVVGGGSGGGDRSGSGSGVCGGGDRSGSGSGVCEEVPSGDSEETLKPTNTNTMMGTPVEMGGSVSSLVSVPGEEQEDERKPLVGPRVIRSVAAGRARSASVHSDLSPSALMVGKKKEEEEEKEKERDTGNDPLGASSIVPGGGSTPSSSSSSSSQPQTKPHQRPSTTTRTKSGSSSKKGARGHVPPPMVGLKV